MMRRFGNLLSSTGSYTIAADLQKKNRLAGQGIVTANAVTLFKSSLRCGGLRRVAPPMPFAGHLLVKV